MQGYKEELFKKVLMTWNNYSGVITHLEPDILDCEVRWALANITMNTASGGDGISAELFKNPKRWYCETAALNMSANLKNSALAAGLEKVRFHSNPKEGHAEEMFNYHTIVLLSQSSKVCSKFFKLVLNSIWTKDFQMYKLGLEKAKEPEIKLPAFVGS